VYDQVHDTIYLEKKDMKKVDALGEQLHKRYIQLLENQYLKALLAL